VGAESFPCGYIISQPGTRTSYGTMLWGKANRASETVDKAQSLVRAARSDGLEVKRYRIGEKYNSHHDYFSSPSQQLKDDRIATFLIYLKVWPSPHLSFANVL
jgi:hypothetical protein